MPVIASSAARSASPHPEYALHCDGRKVDRLADILRTRAAACPDSVALRDANGPTTFAQLDQRANRVGHALRSDGVQAGDRVAFVGGNCAEFLEVLNGAARIGAVATAVNNRLSATEVVAVLADAEPAVVVLGATETGLRQALRDSLSIRQIVCVDPGDSDSSYELWHGDELSADPGYDADPLEPAVLFYTSGTTGQPKGIMLSSDSIGRALSTMHYEIEFTTDAVAMAPVPFFHVAGFGLALVAQLGGTTLLLEPAAGVAELVDLLVRRRVSHAVLVPTVLQAIVDSAEGQAADWSALSYVVYGASPIPLPVIRRATELMSCRFLQSYGLTESTGGVTMLRPEDHLPGPEHLSRLRSAGQALPGIGLKVVNPETLVDVPTGEHGEVLIRGGQVMLGYWRRPEETAQALLPGGWLRTGDGGSLDADGYLYLHDRLKDMIISGGENVFPAEVESVLTEHPGVTEAAVIAVPSQRWGESPHAVVVRSPGATVTQAELLAWATTRLARFKCPVAVTFVGALPRNASGKILKAQLRRDLDVQA